MKIADLKAMIAGRSDEEEVCCTVDHKDYWGTTVKVHPAIDLLETLVYDEYDYGTKVIYDREKIEFATPDEIAEMLANRETPNPYGYYKGHKVKSILVFTY